MAVREMGEVYIPGLELPTLLGVVAYCLGHAHNRYNVEIGVGFDETVRTA